MSTGGVSLGGGSSPKADARAHARPLVVRPITQRAAFAWVGRERKHLPPPAGWLFGVAVESNGTLCHVVVLGRPEARALQNGRTAEVTRAASPKSHAPTPPANHGAQLGLFDAPPANDALLALVRGER